MKGVKKLLFLLIFFMCAFFVFSGARLGISGSVNWEIMEIDAVVSLNMASAGLNLPSGRVHGEMLIASEYLRLIRPEILDLQVDSSSTIANLIERGEFSLADVERLAMQALVVPAALSPDFENLSGFYTLSIKGIRSLLLRHSRAVDIPRTLNPLSTPVYTGIIIIADQSLPVHGTRTSALVRPCLFPKLWDQEMNLIFEKNMLSPNLDTLAYYFSENAIQMGGPTGLSPELSSIVGDRPLRIFSRSVFGSVPTDPVISRDDALQIISRPENRALLTEGRLAVIVDSRMLRNSMN